MSNVINFDRYKREKEESVRADEKEDQRALELHERIQKLKSSMERLNSFKAELEGTTRPKK